MYSGAQPGMRPETRPETQSATRPEIQPGAQPEGMVKIRLPKGPPVMVQDVIRQVSRVMKQYPGSWQAIVYLPPDEKHPKGSSFRTTPDLWVKPDEEFSTRIIRIVGEDNYKEEGERKS